MTDAVLYESQANIATITLNRPEKRNALSHELVEALKLAFLRAQQTPHIAVVVLTAAGDKAFCAGSELGNVSGDGFLGMHQARRQFVELLMMLKNFSKPLLAAAQADAFGGGFGLLLACDWLAVNEQAHFGTPDIKRGLFPMLSVAVMLRTLGRRHTLELTLGGEPIDGHTLALWGGCNLAVPAKEVLPHTHAMARKWAAHSAAVMSLGRQAIYAAEDMTFAQQLEYLRSQLTLTTLSEDAAEGVRAFFEQRDPIWHGR